MLLEYSLLVPTVLYLVVFVHIVQRAVPTHIGVALSLRAPVQAQRQLQYAGAFDSLDHPESNLRHYVRQ